MSDYQFPIIFNISAVITDGETFATLSGASTVCHAPNKEFLLGFIARGMLAAERMGHKGLRLPTPRELMEHHAEQEMGIPMSISGTPASYDGFTQEELDAAVAKVREEQKKANESDEE